MNYKDDSWISSMLSRKLATIVMILDKRGGQHSGHNRTWDLYYMCICFSITSLSIKGQLWCGHVVFQLMIFSSKQILKSWLTMIPQCKFTKVTWGLIIDWVVFCNTDYLSESFGAFESYFLVCWWDRLIRRWWATFSVLTVPTCIWISATSHN